MSRNKEIIKDDELREIEKLELEGDITIYSRPLPTPPSIHKHQEIQPTPLYRSDRHKGDIH